MSFVIELSSATAKSLLIYRLISGQTARNVRQKLIIYYFLLTVINGRNGWVRSDSSDLWILRSNIFIDSSVKRFVSFKVLVIKNHKLVDELIKYSLLAFNRLIYM